MSDGVDCYFVALEIELLRVLILVVVRLGEKGHLGPAVEVVPSQFGEMKSEYSGGASHFHHILERRRRLCIVPRQGDELRYRSRIFDRRMTRLRTLTSRQLAGRGAGVGITQATI